jgi:peptidyl-prolyl cis-trans isomerase B (cyclophilin B)
MRTRPLALVAAPVALTALLTASLAGCSDDSPGAASATATHAASTRTAEGPACTFVKDGSPAAKPVDLPPDRATVSGEVPATLATSAGDITMTLDADAAPCTVTSFASLADQGYFDDTPCHRLTTQGNLLLQCGDPTGTGGGSPGYSFADELSGSETYGAGTVAMANTGLPGSNGSQFFLVYGDSTLPPAYTVFGTLDAAGLRAVRAIAAKGTVDGTPDGAPKARVAISSVTVE